MAGPHRLGKPVERRHEGLSMRALILPAAALALAGAVVLVGGRMVEGPTGQDSFAVDQLDAEAIAAVEAPIASTAALPAASPTAIKGQSAAPVEGLAVPHGVQPPASDIATTFSAEGPAARAPQGAERQPLPPAPSRMVAPTVIAPPELLAGEALLREAPRQPLSQLSLALPPPPPPEFKNPWAGKPLFRPVAVESAVFESGGHIIAIGGVKSIPVDESCTYENKSWPCGVKARAAFRLWLRGRALVCQIPEAEQNKEMMRARCRLAKEDVGAWLVANGWARAAPDGPYVQAEEKARTARIGIFGAPPDTSSIPDVPDAPVSAAAESQQIMTEEGVDPQPALQLQRELPPQSEFPPAPPAP
jgi:endonuclease YncB( thermonuclease family)